MEDEAKSEKELDIWAEDIAFVIKELPKFLKNNLDSVGILGHSFGGAAGLKACYENSQCKAVVNLDGALFWGAPAIYGKPALMMLQDYRRDYFFKTRFPGRKMSDEDKQAYLDKKLGL